MNNELLGALTVLVTTNFMGVSFAPVPCTHPGCEEGHHSYTATERYMVVRETWAEVVGTGENRRIYSDTNDWGSLSRPIAHPSIYFMHTQPGWAVRPGTRWPLDLPPLPPWGDSRKSVLRMPQGLDDYVSDDFEFYLSRPLPPLEGISGERDRTVKVNDSGAGHAAPREILNHPSKAPRRSNTTALPSDTNRYGVLMPHGWKLQTDGKEWRWVDAKGGSWMPLPTRQRAIENAWEHYNYKAPKWKDAQVTLPSDTNHYGVLYNVTSNYPPHKLALEKRSTDRGSGVRVWEGDGVVRYTNPPTSVVSDGRAVWINPPITSGRFRAVPATNALPRSRRFGQ